MDKTAKMMMIVFFFMVICIVARCINLFSICKGTKKI